MTGRGGQDRTRVRRDCRCPKARHEHGDYRAYRADRCRCDPCRGAAKASAATWPSGQRVVDEIAIERAMRGDRVRLTSAERSESVARLTRAGCSARQIAERLGVTERTVVRRRRAA